MKKQIQYWMALVICLCTSLTAMSQNEVGTLPGNVGITPTGSATYTIPIECPSGINGMQPSLSVVYNSQSGEGNFGKGWSLGGFSAISRTTKTIYSNSSIQGIRYKPDDEYSLDGNRLVLKSGTQGNNGAVYSTEIESYQKIESFGQILEKGASSGPEWFRVTTREGLIMEFGRTSDSRVIPKVEFPIPDAGLTAPFQWLINRMEDQNGNYIVYEYGKRNGITYLNYVAYGNTSHTNESLIYLEGVSKSIPDVAFVGGRSLKNGFVYNNIEISTNLKDIYQYAFSYRREYNASEGKDIYYLSKVTRKVFGGLPLPATTILWEEKNTALNSTPSKTITYYPTSKKGCKLYAYDINNDGKDELAVVYRQRNGNYVDFLKKNVESPTLSYETDNSIYFVAGDPLAKYSLHNEYRGIYLADFNGDGIKEFVVASCSGNKFIAETISPDSPTITKYTFPLDSAYSVAPVYGLGDINNDGYDEMVYFERIKTGGVYPGRIYYSKTGMISQITVPLSEFPLALYISDFNCDGLNDLFVMTENRCFFYKNEGGNIGSAGVCTPVFSIPDINSGVNLNKNIQASRIGDFNGDGIQDFIYNEIGKAWYLAISNGNFTFTRYALPMFDVSMNEEENSDFVVMDFDNDGKSDVILAKTEGGKSYITWHKSLGLEFSVFKSFTVDSENYVSWGSSCVGDFNGDGRADLFSYRHNLYEAVSDTTKSNFISSFNQSFGQDLVSSVTDGFGKKSVFEYRPLSHYGSEEYQDYYQHFRTSQHPYHVFLGPLYCLYKMKQLDNLGNEVVKKEYSYGNLILGLTGKGLYGFENLGEWDLINDIRSTTNTTYNLTSGFATDFQKRVMMDKQVSVQKGVNRINKTGRIYSVLPQSGEESDLLTGITSTVTYGNYDEMGNPGFVETKTGTLTHRKDMEYVQKGSWGKNKISKLTESKSDGAGTYSRVSLFDYNDKGNLVKETSDPGDPNQLVVEYSNPTAMGLPQTTTTTGGGITRTSSVAYSPSGRFVTREVDELGQTTTYSWDENRALLNSKTTATGTTSYRYNTSNRLIETITPDNVSSTSTLAWANNTPDKAVYSKTDHTGGQSPVTVWYDCLGRELRNEVYGLFDNKVWTDTEYDSFGRVYRVSRPYFSSESPVWDKTYSYDRYGRKSSIVTPFGTNTYTYSGLTSTVTTPLGTTQTVLDSSGQTIREITDGKSVDYTYYPSGLMKTSTPQGGEAISMEYDLQGNRTKLIDPDAGTVNTVYDAFGQLTKETQRVHRPTAVNPNPGWGGDIGTLYSEPDGQNGIIIPVWGTVTSNYAYLPSGLLSTVKR